jgi:hypothetical protein
MFLLARYTVAAAVFLSASAARIGFSWEARRDEPGREGTLQHGADS